MRVLVFFAAVGVARADVLRPLATGFAAFVALGTALATLAVDFGLATALRVRARGFSATGSTGAAAFRARFGRSTVGAGAGDGATTVDAAASAVFRTRPRFAGASAAAGSAAIGALVTGAGSTLRARVRRAGRATFGLSSATVRIGGGGSRATLAAGSEYAASALLGSGGALPVASAVPAPSTRKTCRSAAASPAVPATAVSPRPRRRRRRRRRGGFARRAGAWRYGLYRGDGRGAVPA